MFEHVVTVYWRDWPRAVGLCTQLEGELIMQLCRVSVNHAVVYSGVTVKSITKRSAKYLPLRTLHRPVLEFMDWDSSVGIITGYGVDGMRIESRWGRDISHMSRPALGPTQPPVQWVPFYFPGLKQPGRGVDYPPHLAPKLKK
jgi:hypothetical protein